MSQTSAPSSSRYFWSTSPRCVEPASSSPSQRQIDIYGGGGWNHVVRFGSWQTLRQALDDGFQSIDRRLQEYGPLEPERFSLQEANQRLAKRLERMRFRA
jgi:hypothetical protein